MFLLCGCYAVARKVAKAKGWPFNWRLVEAPHVGHSASKMFNHDQARVALFGSGKADQKK